MRASSAVDVRNKVRLHRVILGRCQLELCQLILVNWRFIFPYIKNCKLPLKLQRIHSRATISYHSIIRACPCVFTTKVLSPSKDSYGFQEINPRIEDIAVIATHDSRFYISAMLLQSSFLVPSSGCDSSTDRDLRSVLIPRDD